MLGVLDLVTAGNEHLDLTRECATAACIENRLVSACAHYCEATGALAALIDDDLADDPYGDMYPSFVDLSMPCDAAAAQTGAGARANVPLYLDLMREAAVRIEAWAAESDASVAETSSGDVGHRGGAPRNSVRPPSRRSAAARVALIATCSATTRRCSTP